MEKNAKANPKSYEDVLKELGVGRIQIHILVAGILVVINVFTETVGMSNILTAAQCDLGLTSTSKGLLSSIIFFGILLFGCVWGFLGDTQGRRCVILWCLLFSTIFTTISAFISNFYGFLICRFLSGVFVGGYSAVIYLYVGEFFETKHRAAAITWLSLAIGLSTLLMPLAAMWILSYEWKYELYHGYEFRPWRLLLLIYSLPGIFGAIGILLLPESPKFLLAIRQDEKALEVIKWMYRKNKGGLSENLVIENLRPTDNTGRVYGATKEIQSIFKLLQSQTTPLLKPPHLIPFAAFSFIQFGTFCIAGGFVLFFPDILNKILIAREFIENPGVCEIYKFNIIMIRNATNVSENKELCDDSISLNVFGDTLYLGIAYIIGFCILALVVRPQRRKLIIALTLFISSACGFALPFVRDYYTIVVVFILFCLFSSFNISLVNGAACDAFPTNLRSMAVNVSMLFGRFGSFAYAILIGSAIENYCHEIYFVAAIIVLTCFFLACFVKIQ